MNNNYVASPLNPFLKTTIHFYENKNGMTYDSLLDTETMSDVDFTREYTGVEITQFTTNSRKIIKTASEIVALFRDEPKLVIRYCNLYNRHIEIRSTMTNDLNQDMDLIHSYYDIIEYLLHEDYIVCSAPVNEILNGLYWGFRYNQPSDINETITINNSDRYIIHKNNYNEILRYHKRTTTNDKPFECFRK